MRVLTSVLLIAALLAAGGSVAQLLISTKPEPAKKDLDRPPLLVRGVTLERQTIVEPIVGYGTARADRYAWIASQVSGEIVELGPSLRVGASVEAGELIVRIDDREYVHKLDRARSMLAADEAELARLDVVEQNVDRLLEVAEVDLEIAQREYERVLGLFEAQQSPQSELDQARTSFEAARRASLTLSNQKALLPQQRAAARAQRALHEADVGLAQLDIERCTVAAPFRGQIESVEVEIGERVATGARLFALLDPDVIEVPIELPVSLRERVAVDAQCRLKLESSDDVIWSGDVARIAPAAVEATRTFSLYVVIDNTRQEHPLLPGMFVRATIDGPTWTDVLIIPRSAIQSGSVYLCDEGIARPRVVQVQRHLRDRAIVTGLNPGDVVVTSNLDTLFDGAPVRVRPENEAVAESDSSGENDAHTAQAEGQSPAAGGS